MNNATTTAVLPPEVVQRLPPRMTATSGRRELQGRITEFKCKPVQRDLLDGFKLHIGEDERHSTACSDRSWTMKMNAIM
jgi:hypothetical protein